MGHIHVRRHIWVHCSQSEWREGGWLSAPKHAMFKLSHCESVIFAQSIICLSKGCVKKDPKKKLLAIVHEQDSIPPMAQCGRAASVQNKRKWHHIQLLPNIPPPPGKAQCFLKSHICRTLLVWRKRKKKVTILGNFHFRPALPPKKALNAVRWGPQVCLFRVTEDKRQHADVETNALLRKCAFYQWRPSWSGGLRARWLKAANALSQNTLFQFHSTSF